MPSNQLILSFFCSVRPISSKPLIKQCLRNASTSKGKLSPELRLTCWLGKSMVKGSLASASTINISTLSFGRIMGSMPFLKQLLKKMSAKLGAMMHRIPKSFRAHGACSRDDPQPKFSKAMSTLADRYGSLFSTKSVFSVTPSSSYLSSKKAATPSPVRLIVFKNCFGMMQSVSTFAFRRGAVTTLSKVINLGMPPTPPSAALPVLSAGGASFSGCGKP
mmetsp:Transcript_24501/g.39256  ORF Transcript_24501/g.39256 Transcript_24501/m.39256 type:complete len:219 (+) Transcript_24501:564-1220(+)